MRHTLPFTLVALITLGGCSLARGGHADRAVRPVHPAPARAWHRASAERLASYDRAPLGIGETGRAVIETTDARALATAVPPPLSAPVVQDPDPISGAFDALPEGHRWMPEAFLLSGGTLDLLRPGGGRVYNRAWDRDEEFRGGGLGWTVPLGSGWQASAELGVDPQRRPHAGGAAIAFGFGIRR